MPIITPTINRIMRVTEFDLLRTSISIGNMYMCLDSQKLYYDETQVNRVVYHYTGVKTVNDLLHNITPTHGMTYYCWEDNSLWLWMNKWLTLWSDSTYPSAYVYDDNNNLNEIYRYDQPLLPADDNGLLGDGSVVIRDRQRIIKGKIYVDNGNDNFIISSFLGGGMRFLPNGGMETDGELYIGDEGESFIRSQFHILNNEEYIDYSEEPESDPSDYPNAEHKYKVYHEGNLDASAIHIMTPLEIYDKLLDSSLPELFEFNVRRLNGLQSSAFARVGHTHTSANITDFNTTARAQAQLEVRDIFNNMIGNGIDIEYDNVNNLFEMTANNFTLTFANGVTGSGTITHLGNTTINTIVDPTKHIHQNYLDSMDNLQTQIDNINTVDPNDYYTKLEVEDKLSNISGTQIPTPGKPLLIDSNNRIPTTSLSTLKFDTIKQLNFLGDITGSLATDFTNDILDINLDSSNIISAVPTPNKALKLDSLGNLPTNALTSSALDHNIQLSITGEATGTGTLNTATNSCNVNVILVPNNTILQTEDIGSRVASLDENGKVPSTQLPYMELSLSPQGIFNPNSGLPTENPVEGQFWVANTAGTLEGLNYQVNDWCLYLNSTWNLISNNQNVISVNGKIGEAVLNATDVGAIDSMYIDYTLGQVIPLGKIVRTTANGAVSGLSVSNLIDEFSILSDATGDVAFSTNSVRNSTNGSEDLDLLMEITQTGYDKILNQCGLVLYENGTELAKKPQLNFGQGLAIENTGSNQYTLKTQAIGNDYILLYYEEGSTDFLAALENNYNDRSNTPIIVGYLPTTVGSNPVFYLIDGNTPDRSPSTTINVEPTTFKTTENISVNGVCNNTITDMKLQISFGAANNAPVETATIQTNTTNSKGYLTTDILSSITNPFVPTQDYQPASKKYVDQSLTNINPSDYISVDISKYTPETLATKINALFSNRTTKPIMLIDLYNNPLQTGSTTINYLPCTFIIDEKIPSGLTDTTYIIVGSTLVTQNIKNEDNSYTVRMGYPKIQLTFDNSSNITSIDSITDSIEEIPNEIKYIRAGTGSNDIYMAVDGADPVSKGYLDTRLTNGSYTTTLINPVGDVLIPHNLGTEDIIVQFRDNTTKEQILLANTLVDTNYIRVSFDNTMDLASVKVYVTKI